jgi:hypothetical protein
LSKAPIFVIRSEPGELQHWKVSSSSSSGLSLSSLKRVKLPVVVGSTMGILRTYRGRWARPRKEGEEEPILAALGPSIIFENVVTEHFSATVAGGGCAFGFARAKTPSLQG